MATGLRTTLKQGGRESGHKQGARHLGYMAGAAPGVLQIEAFDENLKGKRILQFIASKGRVGAAAAATTPIFEIAEADSGEVFARKVLVSIPSRPSYEFLRTKWDVHYNISDTREWILIVTYIVNAPKPLCLFCEDGVELPDVVMKKLAAVQGVTIICQRGLGGRIGGANLVGYDVVFLPAIDNVGTGSGPESGAILSILNQLSPVKGGIYEDRMEWLKELRITGAGLVWSRASGISWYDPAETIRVAGRSEGIAGRGQSPQVISGYLRVLADMLAR